MSHTDKTPCPTGNKQTNKQLQRVLRAKKKTVVGVTGGLKWNTSPTRETEGALVWALGDLSSGHGFLLAV